MRREYGMTPTERTVILVVKDEGIYAQMLQHFPLDHYELLLATESAEAIALCETRSPRLMVVPTLVADEGLAEVLSEVRHEEALILGLAESDQKASIWRKQKRLFDEVITAGSADLLATKVRQMLEERRQSPRVFLEFPVELGEGGEGLVREFSASSLRVETDEELRGGAIIDVRIGWGPKPLAFKAIVGRIQRALFFAQHSVVLHVQEKETEAKAYLDKLVRGVVELQHILGGDREGTGKLRGDAAWDLTRRVEETVRDSKGLVIRETGEIAVVAELGETQELFTDSIESRYDRKEKIGRWGVGDVHRAVHKLLGRPVLLKVLRGDLVNDADARLRLELEARCAVIWTGNNVVDILDFGSTEDEVYYAMENLTGETLREAMERGQELGPLEVATLGIHLASGLAKIHLKGGGHFDLCPENIYLNRPGGSMIRPLLINIAGRECWGAPERTHAVGARYRPPDAVDQPPDPTFDTYALALILEELLTEDEEESPGTKRLREVLSIATAPSKNQRFRDADAFRAALEDCHATLLMEAPPGLARLVEPPPGTGRISVAPTPVPQPVEPEPSEAAEATARAEKLTTRIPPPPPPPPKDAFDVGVAPPPPPPPDAPDIFPAPAPAPSPIAPASAPEPFDPPEAGASSSREAAPASSSVSVAPAVMISTPPPPAVESSPVGSPVPSPAVSPAPSPAVSPAVSPAPSPVPSPVASPPPSRRSPTLADEEVTVEAFDPDVEFARASAVAAATAAEDAAAPGVARRTGLLRWARPAGVALLATSLLVGLLLIVFVVQPWRRTGGGAGSPAGEARSGGGVVVEVGAARPEAGPAPIDAGAIGSPRPAPDASSAEAPDARRASSPGDVSSPPDQPVEPTADTLRREEMLGRARRRIRSGRHREALTILEEARQLGDGPDIEALIALSLERRGRHADAVIKLRRAVSLAPESPRYQAGLARNYSKLGRWEEACAAARRASELAPTSRTYARRVKRYCR